ncbi:MAG: hypothetical protein WCP22_08835 [Chlamydiota bacterium]
MALAYAVLATAAPAFPDTITYRDGRVVGCIVEEETESAVTVTLHGRRVEIPRSMIAATAKASPGENQALRESWASMRRASRDARTEPALPAPPAGGASGAVQAAAPSRTLVETPPPAPVAGGVPKGAAMKGMGQPLPPDRQRDLRWKGEVRNAVREKRVLVGMTEKEVSSAWGSPDRTHPVHGVDVSSDRWTFRREGEGLVDIYFKNGVVTNISR